MKKLLALAIAASALTAGTAQAALQHGFEVGVRGGYAWQHDEDLNVRSTFTAGAQTLNYTKDLHDNGWLGGIFAGYNWVCNSLLFGVDLSADWLNADDSHQFLRASNTPNNFLNEARFEKDFMYGASARLGYKGWDTISPFVRLGIERVNNKLDLNIDSTVAVPVRQLGLAKTTHETGYLAGLGMDIPVFNKNTNVRIEYQYHWQNRADFDFSSALLAGKADIKPKMHLLTIGLLWSQV